MLSVTCPKCGQTLASAADRRCSWCGHSRAHDETVTVLPPAQADAPTLTRVDGASSSAGHTALPAGADAIPGYTIVEELGRGGMGVVYRANETSLNRPVALKVLLAGAHAGANERIRFQAEAEAAAAIQHPNIVHVYAVGQHGGLPYMAQELVPGGALAKRLAAGPLEPKEAAHVVQAIARGVQAAHDRGIVHRDLKPANVLFATSGEPKVADFGLAKSGDTGLTASGAIMGTPAYMSPEQARGETKSVGPATDIWALGAMLYECLSGQQPFRGQSAPETLRLVCETEPAALAGVPKDLATIAQKCLEKNAANRYATAGAVADDLRRYLAGEAITARRPGLPQRLRRWTRRHRGPVYVAGGALLAALVSVIIIAARPKPTTPASPPDELAGLPIDLAVVSPESSSFISIRPNEIHRRPELSKLLGGLFVPDEPEQIGDFAAIVERMIGLRLNDLERLTLASANNALFGGERNPQILVTARTAAPVPLKNVRDALENLLGGFQAQEHRARRYYVAQMNEMRLALWRAGERDLVFGTVPEVLAAIDRLEDGFTAGLMTPALTLAAEGHTAVAAVRTLAEFRSDIKIDSAPEIAAAINHLVAAQLTTIVVDLLPATPECSVPGINVLARTRFASAERAAEAARAVRRGCTVVSTIKPHGAGGGFYALLPALQKAVGGAEINQEGAELTVQLQPRWTSADWEHSGRPPVHTAEHKLKQIGLALHNYESNHGRLPAAVTRSPDGKPLYSWRVEILPYMEQDSLFRQLNLKEAWNHPDNKELLFKAPDIYAMDPARPDAKPTHTRFQAVVAKGGIFDPVQQTRFLDIADGSSETLLVIEAGTPVHWAEPVDITYNPAGPIPKLGDPIDIDCLALMANGSIKVIPRDIRLEMFNAMVTRSGGETIEWDRLRWSKKK